MQGCIGTFRTPLWESVREGRSSSFVTWSLCLGSEGKALGKAQLGLGIQGCRGDAGQRTRQETARVSTGFSTSSLCSFSSHFPEHALCPAGWDSAGSWLTPGGGESALKTERIHAASVPSTTAACAACIPVSCAPAIKPSLVLHRQLPPATWAFAHVDSKT